MTCLKPWALKNLPPFRPVAVKLLRLTAREDVPLAGIQAVLRTDVAVEVLASYLELVLEGLVTHLAEGLPGDAMSAVLDVVEMSVRRS